MIPAVFKDSELWFRLWQAAFRTGQVRDNSALHQRCYTLTAMIDGEPHYIRFNALTGGTPLTLYIVIDGPEIGTHMTGMAVGGIAFSISYKITWKKGAGVEAIDPRYAVNGGELMRFITKNYESRQLPSFYEKSDCDAIEHVVMMFILSTEGVMS